MNEADQRYTRQIRLAEVGVAGQARLAAAALDCGVDRAGRVEREYLKRAGVGSLHDRLAEGPMFAHAASFRHPGCREVAAGAWRALRQINTTLGLR